MFLDIIPRLPIGGTLAGVPTGHAVRRRQLTLGGGADAAFGVDTAAAIRTWRHGVPGASVAASPHATAITGRHP